MNNLIKYCFTLCLIVLYLVFSYTYSLAEQNSKKKITKKENVKKISHDKNKLVIKKTKNVLKYKIKKGDTIRKIAKEKGISEKEILCLNKNINPKMLIPGQVILIPKLVQTKSKKYENNFAMSNSSKQYSVADDEIKKLRKLKNNSYTSPIEYEDFDGDEDVAVENTTEIETKKVEYLYSLRDDDLKKLINSALDYVGANYKYGGDSIASLDCSAFVRRVFKEVNIDLPRTSREQYTLGIDVSMDELKEGDLLFFARKKRIDHVGIYIGNNMYIHAARKGKGVIVSSLESPYVKRYFVGAKRIFTLQSASNQNVLKEELIN